MRLLWERGFLVAAAALCSTIPLGAQARLQGGAPAEVERTWLAGSWRLVGSMETGPGASAGIAVGKEALYAFDGDNHQLRAFTLDGRPLWRAGGADEQGGVRFRRGRDPKVDGEGMIWVADHGEGARAVIVTPDGRSSRGIGPLPQLHSVLPQSGGTFWALLGGRSVPRVYAATGREIGALELPPSVARAHFLAAELHMCSATPGVSVIAYRWSDRFLIIRRSGASVQEYRGVERHEFPAIQRQSIEVNKSRVPVESVESAALPVTLHVAADRERIYFLRPEQPKGSGSIIDVHLLSNGRYVGSYRLPERVRYIAVLGDRIFGATSGTPGVVRVWQRIVESR